MKRISTLAAAVLAAAFVAAGLAGASRADTGEIVFSAAEKAIIAHYYGDDAATGGKGNKGGRGQGVGNRGLPPGLAKKGGQLPPGIAKRQLPSALTRELPPPPKGFERVIVDDDILLVEITTQIVHDVLTDAVRSR